MCLAPNLLSVIFFLSLAEIYFLAICLESVGVLLLWFRKHMVKPWIKATVFFDHKSGKTSVFFDHDESERCCMKRIIDSYLSDWKGNPYSLAAVSYVAFKEHLDQQVDYAFCT